MPNERVTAQCQQKVGARALSLSSEPSGLVDSRQCSLMGLVVCPVSFMWCSPRLDAWATATLESRLQVSVWHHISIPTVGSSINRVASADADGGGGGWRGSLDGCREIFFC